MNIEYCCTSCHCENLKLNFNITVLSAMNFFYIECDKSAHKLSSIKSNQITLEQGLE